METRSITHIIPSLELGGAEVMLTKLVARMNPTRWNSAVLSLRGRGPLGDSMDARRIRIASVGMRGSMPGLRSLWRLRREVRALAPQLIQGWMYHGNLAALAGRAFRGRRPPVVWNIRSDVFEFSTEKRLTAVVVRLGALLSSCPDRIIYNSRSSARGHADLGFASGKTVVIPNGFDTRTFAPSRAARAVLRRRLGVPDDVVLIGRIGRYHPVKDFPAFLKAAAILRGRHKGARFVLAGPGVDGDNAELVGLVNRLGLNNAVHLLGEARPAHQIVAALDILCSSSAYGESFPNVLGEAMACEVPCVTTDLGDSAWIVGEAGRVVPPRDPAALAAACEMLVDLGLDGRHRMGAIGRARVLREFSLEHVVSQYEDLYDDLLERGARR